MFRTGVWSTRRPTAVPSTRRWPFRRSSVGAARERSTVGGRVANSCNGFCVVSQRHTGRVAGALTVTGSCRFRGRLSMWWVIGQAKQPFVVRRGRARSIDCAIAQGEAAGVAFAQSIASCIGFLGRSSLPVRGAIRTVRCAGFCGGAPPKSSRALPRR